MIDFEEEINACFSSDQFSGTPLTFHCKSVIFFVVGGCAMCGGVVRHYCCVLCLLFVSECKVKVGGSRLEACAAGLRWRGGTRGV